MTLTDFCICKMDEWMVSSEGICLGHGSLGADIVCGYIVKGAKKRQDSGFYRKMFN